jgi:hypothetical protein
MGRIWTETGAIRAIQRKGYLNCFSSPQGRYFVVSSMPLSREGSVLLYAVGCSLMLKRKLKLVGGDSFAAAYRLRVLATAPSNGKAKPAKKSKPLDVLAEGNVSTGAVVA